MAVAAIPLSRGVTNMKVVSLERNDGNGARCRGHGFHQQVATKHRAAIEEIVVTATRVGAQSVQQTPLAITALFGQPDRDSADQQL